jgi:hypothetical protein
MKFLAHGFTLYTMKLIKLQFLFPNPTYASYIASFILNSLDKIVNSFCIEQFVFLTGFGSYLGREKCIVTNDNSMQ